MGEHAPSEGLSQGIFFGTRRRSRDPAPDFGVPLPRCKGRPGPRRGSAPDPETSFGGGTAEVAKGWSGALRYPTSV